MDFPKRIYTIGIGWSILYFRDHMSKILNYDIFMPLNIVFILANSADPDEMLP